MLTANRTDGAYFYGDPHRPLSGRHYGYLGWSPLASVSDDTTVPAAPTGLTASAGDAQVTLEMGRQR